MELRDILGTAAVLLVMACFLHEDIKMTFEQISSEFFEISTRAKDPKTLEKEFVELSKNGKNPTRAVAIAMVLAKDSAPNKKAEMLACAYRSQVKHLAKSLHIGTAVVFLKRANGFKKRALKEREH